MARCRSRGGSSLSEFAVKDSGKRLEFEGGMVRDTTEGKINYMLIRPGPMLKRWAAHLSRAASKYDNTRKPGEPRNWQLARGLAEFERFQESAARHFEQWLNGDRDEDHAAGVFFNINGAEYVLEQLANDASRPYVLAPVGALRNHLTLSDGDVIVFEPNTDCPDSSCTVPGRHEGKHFDASDGARW